MLRMRGRGNEIEICHLDTYLTWIMVRCNAARPAEQRQLEAIAS